MDKKTLTLVLAVALIGSFFLAYLGGASGFDIVKSSDTGMGNNVQVIILQYIWILFPLSGIMLLIGAVSGNYIINRGLWAWLPMLALLTVLIVLPLINGKNLFTAIKDLINLFGIGLWIAIAASLVLAFYNPKGK